jgi:putative GTP pyrophosphokinase
MDFWASLEHKMYYKFYGKAPKSIREELMETANIIAFLDDKMLKINQKIQKDSGDITQGQDFSENDDRAPHTTEELDSDIDAIDIHATDIVNDFGFNDVI